MVNLHQGWPITTEPPILLWSFSAAQGLETALLSPQPIVLQHHPNNSQQPSAVPSSFPVPPTHHLCSHSDAAHCLKYDNLFTKSNSFLSSTVVSVALQCGLLTFFLLNPSEGPHISLSCSKFHLFFNLFYSSKSVTQLL